MKAIRMSAKLLVLIAVNAYLAFALWGLPVRPMAATGHVTIAGTPSPGLSITITKIGGGWTKDVPLPPDGVFSVQAPGPGRYAFTVGSVRSLPVAEFVSELSRENSHVTLNLPAGRLTTHFALESGEPIASKVSLRIEGPLDSSDRLHVNAFIGPEAEGRLSLLGLPIGRYLVSGRTSDGYAGSIRLEASEGERHGAAPTVTMRKRPDATVLVNSGLNPASVVVAVGGVKLGATPDQAGFVLTGAAPGEELSVGATGFQPTCRVLSEADWPILRIELTPSERLHQVTVQNLARVLGRVRGVVGAQCDIPLAVAGAGYRERTANGRGIVVSVPVAGRSEPRYVLENFGIDLPLHDARGAETSVPDDTDSCLRRVVVAERARALPLSKTEWTPGMK